MEKEVIRNYDLMAKPPEKEKNCLFSALFFVSGQNPSFTKKIHINFEIQ